LDRGVWVAMQAQLSFVKGEIRPRNPKRTFRRQTGAPSNWTDRAGAPHHITGSRNEVRSIRKPADVFGPPPVGKEGGAKGRTTSNRPRSGARPDPDRISRWRFPPRHLKRGKRQNRTGLSTGLTGRQRPDLMEALPPRRFERGRGPKAGTTPSNPADGARSGIPNSELLRPDFQGSTGWNGNGQSLEKKKVKKIKGARAELGPTPGQEMGRRPRVLRGDTASGQTQGDNFLERRGRERNCLVVVSPPPHSFVVLLYVSGKIFYILPNFFPARTKWRGDFTTWSQRFLPIKKNSIGR